MMSSLGALQKAVEEVVGPSSKRGCRVIADVKDQSVRVYDLHRWTQEYSELLRCLNPQAKVNVHSSTQSLSGFLIYITEEEKPKYLWIRIFWVCLFLVGFLWYSKSFEAGYAGLLYCVTSKS